MGLLSSEVAKEAKERPMPRTVHKAHSSPLLPPPVASIVSLVTATSSLSLRIGGFLGHLAINVSRLGTLSGIELGRAVLESVLFRAGQDVLGSSSGGIGQATAETILDNTVRLLLRIFDSKNIALTSLSTASSSA